MSAAEARQARRSRGGRARVRGRRLDEMAAATRRWRPRFYGDPRTTGRRETTSQRRRRKRREARSWTRWPYTWSWQRPTGRKGSPCRIVAVEAGKAVVEFPDGHRD